MALMRQGVHFSVPYEYEHLDAEPAHGGIFDDHKDFLFFEMRKVPLQMSDQASEVHRHTATNVRTGASMEQPASSQVV